MERTVPVRHSQPAVATCEGGVSVCLCYVRTHGAAVLLTSSIIFLSINYSMQHGRRFSAACAASAGTDTGDRISLHSSTVHSRNSYTLGIWIDARNRGLDHGRPEWRAGDRETADPPASRSPRSRPPSLCQTVTCVSCLVSCDSRAFVRSSGYLRAPQCALTISLSVW